MMRNRLRRFIGPVCALALVAGVTGPVRAADINVDLDGTGASESNVKLNVVTTYPAKVKNTITNKAVGQAFQFRWLSAGPGGFSSQVATGTSGGVGTQWVWQTTQSIFTFTGNDCNTDVCFTRVSDGAGRGPFSAPGRSLTSANVTVSNASLTSSVITFLSPPQELASVTSSVEQLASGGFRYITRVQNPTTDTITIDLRPGPLGCSTSCDEGETNCGGVCVDTDNDPNNCGECGNDCDEGEVCSSGECTPYCPEGETNCGGVCVDTQTDEKNCGECGNECNPDLCEYGVNCVLGECQCVIGAVPGGDSKCDFGGVENVTIPPGGVFETCSTNLHPAKEVTSQLVACGPSIPDGPSACSNNDLASQGPFNVFVPDTSKTIGDVFITPYKVLVLEETSGDGIIQPGETAKLRILLLNAGSETLTDAVGVLSSPPIDQSEDGTPNETSVNITTATSPYQDIVGTDPLGSDDCDGAVAAVQPVANLVPFVVTFPAAQPGDVARPFFLDVTGNTAAALAGGPTSTGGGHAATTLTHNTGDAEEGADELTGQPPMNVPITFGIGSACNPSIGDGDFDRLEGLAAPMENLVLPGLDPPFPRNAFNMGRTIPLKLRLKCGGVTVGSGATPPEIVGLTRLGNPNVEIDVQNTELGDNPNNSGLSFRLTGSQWHYNLRSKALARGTYILRIRMPNAQDYVAGFVLR